MRVHITPRSGNAKTGPIPVTTTERASCPTTCPFYSKGCYAKSGPLALHWRKVSDGERGTDWQGLTKFVRSLPDRQLWRHNQAGDLPHINGQINGTLLGELVRANKGKRGFTYTHHKLDVGLQYVVHCHCQPSRLHRQHFHGDLSLMLSLLSIADCQRFAWCLVITLIVSSMMILCL